MITVVGGTKGGSGKSTVATNLAIMLAAGGGDVLLVDADDQETATDFTNLREASRTDGAGYNCVALTGAAVRSGVQRLAPKHAHVIIDTGGREPSASARHSRSATRTLFRSRRGPSTCGRSTRWPSSSRRPAP